MSRLDLIKSKKEKEKKKKLDYKTFSENVDFFIRVDKNNLKSFFMFFLLLKYGQFK